MLVDLVVSNFRSLKNEVVFSMEPASENGGKKNLMKTDFNKIPYVYKTSGIFGANASGKTNLLVAVSFLKFLVRKGAFTNVEGQLPEEYYRFEKGWDKKPTRIQIRFFKGYRLYEYGISIKEGFVVNEKAYYSDFSEKGSKRQNIIFSRELKDNDKYEFSLSRGIKKAWSDELLSKRVFLSDMINNRNSEKVELRDIYEFIQNDIVSFDEVANSFYDVFRKIAESPEKGKEIIEFTKTADLGLEKITVRMPSKEEFFKKNPVPDTLDNDKKEKLYQEINPLDVRVSHKTEDGSLVEMPDETESEGTRLYLAISDRILEALKNGKVVFIDELDESLHPYLVRHLVNMFNNSKTRAQLIFTSHAHYLMDGEALTRDQIWFTSKENGFYTELYPLSDFDVDRKRQDFYKSYIRGIYGAVPNVFEGEKWRG